MSESRSQKPVSQARYPTRHISQAHVKRKVNEVTFSHIISRDCAEFLTSTLKYPVWEGGRHGPLGPPQFQLGRAGSVCPPHTRSHGRLEP